MFRITVGNVYSKVLPTVDDDLHRKVYGDIYKHLSVFHDAAKWSEKYNTILPNGKRMWDGYFRFFTYKTGAVLTGLLPQVVKVLQSLNMEFTVVDTRVPPTDINNITPVYELPGHPPLYDHQKEGVDIGIKARRGIFSLATNSGKGHPKGTPILTPTGWASIETLDVGSEVIAGDGTVTTISGVFCRGPQQTYRMIFNDRTDVVCDSDHLWKVQSENSRKGNWNIVPTHELVERKHTLSKRAIRLRIPICDPIQFEKKRLPIDPYVLGVLLGDGSLCGSTPRITNPDTDIIDVVREQYTVHNQKHTNRCPTYSVLNIFDVIKDLGLSGKRSHEKFIPEPYLTSSVDDRLALLRGLMDTDGHIGTSGRNWCSIEYSTSSLPLAISVLFLVRSLGEKATFCTPKLSPKFSYKGEIRTGKPSYRIHIVAHNNCPFLLKRKADKFIKGTKSRNKHIVDIVDAGIQDTICIAINHPSQLYITKDFIVTHNTALAVALTESLKVRTLFLVDRRELFTQAVDTYQQHGSMSVGTVKQSTFKPGDVTVAMVKTLFNRISKPKTKKETLQYLHSVNLVWADEAHKSTANTWKGVLKNLPNAYYRFGLSGTPVMGQNVRDLTLIGYTGPLIQDVTNKEMTDTGVSAMATVYMVDYSPERAISGLDYKTLYLDELVHKDGRNKAITHLVEKHHTDNKSILIVVSSIAHGQLLQEQLKQLGLDVPFACGELTSSEERDHVYNGFRENRIPIVIASMIYKEGVNLPNIDVLIYAAGGKSIVTVKQVIGRGLRIRDDKDKLIFYDFRDTHNYIFLRHSRQRSKIYRDEKFTVHTLKLRLDL